MPKKAHAHKLLQARLAGLLPPKERGELKRLFRELEQAKAKRKSA